MREIKFRVALMGYKKLLKVTKIEDDEEFGRMISCENDEDEIQDYYHNDYELMQYTGLKDKNGVEIYEGDFLKYEDGLALSTVYYDMEETAFMARLNNNINSSVSLKAFIHKYEVTGNIYENPELLETT